ncbi:MAG: HNH endonuclease [Acidobacteriota bacterium]
MPNYSPQDILTYLEMCSVEGLSLQQGMNYRDDDSIFLMSRRVGAPYEDRLDPTTNILTYEGHDASRSAEIPDPKAVDQPFLTSFGTPTRNKKFFDAAKQYENRTRVIPLRVRVYEKLRPGIWVFNGTFALEKAWIQASGPRTVFKFSLSLLPENVRSVGDLAAGIDHTRMIPSAIKQEVFKRDRGQCVLCGVKDNLHFDHDLAFKHGGTSLLAENIRLLCARHNLRKGARIE